MCCIVSGDISNSIAISSSVQVGIEYILRWRQFHLENIHEFPYGFRVFDVGLGTTAPVYSNLLINSVIIE